MIVRLREDKKRYQEDRYGNCPVCGYTDGYVNISCNHWFVCHQHKTKWFVGSNLFADWQSEREVDWLGNAVLLGQYKDVNPKANKRQIPASAFQEREAANLKSLKHQLQKAVDNLDFSALRHVAENCLKAAENRIGIIDRNKGKQMPRFKKLANKQPQNVLNRRRILIIDDDPLVRASTIRIFNRGGYYVQAAASANEGLERTMCDYFDCALIDLKLPDMDGMEIVRNVRELRQNMAVLIITGYGTAETSAEAKRLGVADYIHKPFEPEKLVSAVEHAIR